MKTNEKKCEIMVLSIVGHGEKIIPTVAEEARANNPRFFFGVAVTFMWVGYGGTI